MAIFNFELTRTYSTSFEIEAENQKEAFKKFQSLGEEMFSEEMEQCNVIEEVVKGDKYARCCNCCGNGMNEGYFAEYEYFCSTECLFTEFPFAVWQKLSEDENDSYYWTQWEDIEDYQYQIINGELQDVEDIFSKINENLGFR
jgi:hypothetical protein